MKLHLRLLAATFTLLFPCCSLFAQTAGPSGARLELAADAGWKFVLADPQGAEQGSFSDVAWRTVDLPHDWSIESSPEKSNPGGAGEGFFPGGVGWYRKAFSAPAAWQGKRISVEFDGVYRNATVYLNGHKVGTHPYGYTSFAFDLTSYLNFTGSNVLSVRVDNSAQPNSRWYSGSGIYRHVRMVVTDPTHVAHWGVFVTTPGASSASAAVSIRTRVVNESGSAAEVTVKTTLYDRAGREAGTKESTLSLAPAAELEAAQTISIANPALWSPASPTLYKAVSQVSREGKVVDQITTPFGIRSLAWTVEKGLLLNGQSIKLTGGSVHHDNGPLGAAAFDRAEVRRVELLKAAGHNAVRTAHNPPSPAFLDACDRLGLLVLDEPFDMWRAHKVKFDYGTSFDEWSKRDIDAFILRDRNHPSIVIWSIGNEIPELEVAQGKELAKQLADQVRALDSTRPLTLAFPGNTTTPNAQGVFSQLDITGYNYNILPTYAADHQRFPQRLMLTTESYPAKSFPLWKVSHDNPYILGDLTWTAMDYLGESGIGAWAYGTPAEAQAATQVANNMASTEFIDKFFLGMAKGEDMMAAMSKLPVDPAVKAVVAMLTHDYPWHSAVCGDLDLTGFRKPQSFYRDILWNRGDRVYATVRLPDPEGKKIIAVGWATYPTLPTWSWPGQEGKEMQVEVYSGVDKVRLFLNDKLIGEKLTGEDQEFKATFSVPYAPGTLKAVGLRGDKPVAQSILSTAGNPARLRITADRTALQADGQDLSYLVVEAVDAQGRLQPHADHDVQFSITGPGIIAAVGNADAQDTASYQGSHRKLFEGRALVVVRTSRQAGTITVKASTPGWADGVAKLEAKAAAPRPELR